MNLARDWLVSIGVFVVIMSSLFLGGAFISALVMIETQKTYDFAFDVWADKCLDLSGDEAMDCMVGYVNATSEYYELEDSSEFVELMDKLDRSTEFCGVDKQGEEWYAYLGYCNEVPITVSLSKEGKQ